MTVVEESELQRSMCANVINMHDCN